MSEAQPPVSVLFALERVIDGKPGAGEKRLVRSSLLIGRGAVDWPIPLDPKASKYHALVLTRDQKLFLSDLATANGTAVNNALVRPGELVELKSDDIILVGLTRFRVHGVDADTAAKLTESSQGRRSPGEPG